MQMRILVGEFTPRGLRPHHEGVHRALNVRFPLLGAVGSRRHRHQRPVVALEEVTDGVLDLLREFLLGVVRSAGLGFGPAAGVVVVGF